MEDNPKDPETVYRDAQDVSLRSKFSKILKSPLKPRKLYDLTDERVTYSWEEIFYEIGKLQERADRPQKTEYITTPNTGTPWTFPGNGTWTCGNSNSNGCSHGTSRPSCVNYDN
jgi:hypothetical protein